MSGEEVKPVKPEESVKSACEHEWLTTGAISVLLYRFVVGPNARMYAPRHVNDRIVVRRHYFCANCLMEKVEEV